MSAKKTVKKSTPKTQEPKEPEVAELPMELSKEDQVVIQLAYSSLEVIQLKLKLAQVEIEKMQVEKERLEKQVANLAGQVNTKYSLSAGKDTLNVGTGKITRS